MPERNYKFKSIKINFKKLFPKFSIHYFAYIFAFIFVVFSVVGFVTAATPNPGHPWSELGDGVFTFTSGQTSTNYTYTFPAANTTVLTTNAAVTVTQGGTGLTSIASGSILAANSANVLSAVTSTTGTKVLTNTTGVITWETAPSSMVYPGSGIPVSTGSAWGTSITASSGLISNISDEVGTGYLVFNDSPTFTTKITSPLVLGGSSTTADLTLQTTSGVGATGADMHFLVGNNGATEAMTILNDGKVGIGTTAPTAKLQVDGIIKSGNDLGTNGGSTVDGEIRSYQATGYPIYVALRTDAATARRSGLYRNNAGFFNYYDTNTGDIGMDAQYSGANLVFQIGSVEKMRVANSGNVGIGTTSPTSLLSLGGTAARTIQMERNTTAATAGQGLTLSSGGAIAGTADLAGGDLNLKSGISTGTGSSAMRFFTATAGTTGTTDRTPTEKMTILGNGNVGIGITNPTSKLQVSGDYVVLDKNKGFVLDGFNAGGRNRIWGVSTVWPDFGFSYFEGTTDYIGFHLSGNPAASNFGISGAGSVSIGNILFRQALDVTGNAIISGNVGIGTTVPTTKFYVNDNASTSLGIKGITLKNDSTLDYLNIWNYNANNYAIQSADEINYRELLLNPFGGNVGIGTTSPLKTLHVAKDLTYSQSQSGQLYVGGATDTNKRLMLGYDTTNNFGFIEGVNYGTAYSNVVINPYAGNVGIGTTNPVYKLETAGGRVKLASGQATEKEYGTIVESLEINLPTLRIWG